MQIVRLNCFGAYENFFFVIFLSKLSYDVITRLLFKVIFDLNSIFPLFFFISTYYYIQFEIKKAVLDIFILKLNSNPYLFLWRGFNITKRKNRKAWHNYKWIYLWLPIFLSSLKWSFLAVEFMMSKVLFQKFLRLQGRIFKQ